MTVDTESLKADLVAGFARSVHLRAHGDNTLVVMPQTFSDGTILSLLVSDCDGVVTVTDRGTTADQLSSVDVDITKGVPQASWRAVRTSAGMLPAMGAEDWELTAAGSRDDLATLVQAVADTALRAEGLRALSRTRRSRTFGDRVIGQLVDSNLPVIPRASMKGRHGSSRQVTCRIEITSGYYVQALGGRDTESRSWSFDHAASLFSTAHPDKSHRFAVLQGSGWPMWQIEGLREVARVADEDELQDVAAELLAHT